MPLSSPQQKNAQSYNAIKNGLYRLNQFISTNGSIDLFTLFTEIKKTEIDDLFFTPPRQSNSGTIKKGKLIDLLTRTDGWFTDSNKDDPANIIRENVFKLFSFNEKKSRELRQELIKSKQFTEQAIIDQLEGLEKKIDKLTPDETFKYINLYISVRWDNILSLVRFKEIRNSLSAKQFTSLSPENYELLKNKQAAENLFFQDTNHDLSFLNLGRIKEWPKVKQGILNNLVPPQIDSLSPASTSSSAGHAQLGSVASINEGENPAENNSVPMQNLGPTTSAQIANRIPNKLEQEITQLKNAKKELEEENLSLKDLETKLETQIAELQKLLQNNEALQQESESSKQQLVNLETAITNLKKKIENKEAEVKSLKEIKEENSLSLRILESDLQKTQKEKNDLTTKLKETEATIKALETNNIKLATKIDKTNKELEETTNTLALRSSDHVAISKQLNDLQTQHSEFQNFLENQKKLFQEDLQTKEVGNNLLHIDISKLNDEICIAKNKLNDTEKKFAEASKKCDEFQKTIDALQLNKIESEEQKNNLFKEKANIQARLTDQIEKQINLSANFEKLKADLETTQEDLIATKQKLVEQTELSKQLQFEIEDKTKLIQTQLDGVAESDKASQQKNKKLHDVHKQLETLKQKLKEAEKAEKISREKLTSNVLKIQTLEEAIKKLESLPGAILQETEKNRVLSVNLNLEKDGREKLEQQLNELCHEIYTFCQTMKDDLKKLNPLQKIIREGQNPTETILSEEAQKILSSPIQQALTALVDNNEQNDIPSNDLAIENLNLLKLQTISSLNTLINKSATKEQQLSVNKETIAELQKELQKSAEKIKELTKNIERLTQSHVDFDESSDDDFDEHFLYDDLPVNSLSTDNIDTQQEITHNQYLDNIFNELPEFKKIQKELQHKLEEISQLKDQLESQETLQIEIDTLKEFSKKAAETTSVLETEKVELDTHLKIVQKALEESNNEITRLKSEHVAKLTENGSINKDKISKLTEINEFMKRQGVQENSIQDLLSKIAKKDEEIEGLAQQKQKISIQLTDLRAKNAENIKKLQEDLKDSSSQVSELQKKLAEKTENIKKLAQEKKQLAENFTTLNKDLGNLKVELQTTKESLTKSHGELDEANKKLTQSKEEAGKLSNDNNKLKLDIEIYRNIHSELEIKYASLEKDIKEKNEEIKKSDDQITKNSQQLQNSKQEVEGLATRLKEAEQNTQSLEEQLRELKNKETAMPNTKENLINFETPLLDKNGLDQINLKTNLQGENDSSSGNSSGPSTPHGSNEKINSLFGHLSPFNQGPGNSGNASDGGDSLIGNAHDEFGPESSLSSNEDKQPKTNLTNSATSMPTQEQPIDNLLSDPEFKNHLTRTLAARLENLYKKALTDELNLPIENSDRLLLQPSEVSKRQLLAGDTVDHLLNNEDTKKEIKEALTQIISESEEENLLYPENAAKEFLDIFIKLNSFSAPADYPKCYDRLLNSLDANKANAQAYVALLKLCDEQILSPQMKQSASIYIQTQLENGLTAININPEEYREAIIRAASGFVNEILNPRNMLEALEAAKVSLPNSSNLLQTTKDILSKQCNAKIKSIIEDNFAHIFIDGILEKINNGVKLSADEIQKLPPQLQYADTVNDFELGLKSEWPNLNYFNASAALREKCFRTARSLLRINALGPLTQLNPEELLEEINHHDAEAWLEKKLQLITGKPVNLELVQLEKEQKNSINELSSSLHLSTLYDIAITGKSIPDLIQEIEKVSKIQLSAAEQVSQIFQDIDTKQAAYPELIDDQEFVDFVDNLNQPPEEQDKALPKINADQATILLMRINQELAKNKWAFAYNKTDKEIISDSLVNISQQEIFNFTKDESKELIVLAWKVLCKNPNDDLKKIKQWLKLTLEKREQGLKDTLKKREHWLKDITLHYIATKELLAFSKKIEKNKAKFIDLKELKETNPESSGSNEKISDVYLPTSCTIVANSSDPDFSAHLPVEDESFKIDTIFYKQNALKINQTLTFSQTLLNKNEQTWSVSRIDDTRLVYQTHKSWLDSVKNLRLSADNLMTYVRSNSDKQFNAEEEVLLTQLTHAVNSSKNKICTITLPKNCPKRKERFIRCFIDNHNKNKSDKEPILECRDNDKLKMHKAEKINAMNKIQNAFELNRKELENANTLSKEVVNRRPIRPRG